MYITDGLQLETVGKVLKITVGKASTLSTTITYDDTLTLLAQLPAFAEELKRLNQSELEVRKAHLAKVIKDAQKELVAISKKQK